MVSLHATDAKGCLDVEVTCQGPFAKPPQACFLDGLQVATGAMLGGQMLHWVHADQIAVRMKNTKTAKVVVARPTPKLTGLLPAVGTPPKAANEGPTRRRAHDADLESVARKIASMPESEISTTEPTQ
jgi:formylmethanofuran dehydrogenase subunit E